MGRGLVHDPTNVDEDARIRRHDKASVDALHPPVDLHIISTDVDELVTVLKAPPFTDELTRIALYKRLQEMDM